MKNMYISKSRDLTSRFLSFFIILCCLSIPLTSVDGQADRGDTKVNKPVRATFNSAWLIDNQSVMVPIKGTFEFDMLHRFGTMGNGFDDLYGLYASSNMKMGFSYAPINNLSVGFGLTKRKHLLDFNAKYALIKQMTTGFVPISATYYTNVGIDVRRTSTDAVNRRGDVFNNSDRYSFFHQLIIARKFSNAISLQIAGSVSHYNLTEKTMTNDHYAISGGGKIKITESLSCIFNVDQPITKHQSNNPNPNMSLGLEVGTSSHAFQIFIGNYSSILPQENNVFNTNNYAPADGESLGDNFLIGFNITRLWNW